MTSRQGELVKLERVLEAAFQVEQMQMAELTSRIDLIRDRLTALRQSSARTPKSEIDPAQRVGADILWESWADSRRRDLNSKLALLRQEKELRHEKLVRAFGKLQAVREMSRRLAIEVAKRSRD